MIKKIAIRADGGTNKGMGHIMRCIAISKELKNQNIEIIFITKNDLKVNEILKLNSIKYINIYSNCLISELKEVINIIKSFNIDAVLTDSYWLSNEYLIELKESVSLLISIDDNGLYDYPSDIVINGNIHGVDIIYNKINKNTRYLLGTKYCILREEFANTTPIYIKENIESILVTMGGADINNYTAYILDSIKKLNYKINVVVGSSFKDINSLKEIASKNKNISLIFNPKSMKSIMIENDIAISAAGSTTYELGVLGIPTMIIVQADNQEKIAKKVEELGMMINLGDFKTVTKEEIYLNTCEIINDYKKRKSMSNISMNNISKKGISNIVKNILNYNI